MVEWEATAVVLGAAAFGENDLLVTVLTEPYGPHRGLVRGGQSRRQRAGWEIGNVTRVRWRARLADQLGQFTGEAVATPYIILADRPLELQAMLSACAVARGALPERSECIASFTALMLLLARLTEIGGVERVVPGVLRFERLMLSELGFGLDLERCSLTGADTGLAFVSPRTGRAVTASAAAEWADRLLKLPAVLLDDAEDARSGPADWLDGLRLTGHFLARDAFGARHQDLPPERQRLLALMERKADPAAWTGER